MKAPQRAEPVIGIVGQPVGAVHGHDRDRDQQPARPVLRGPQLDPGCVAADQHRRPDAEQGHQRDHHDGVQGEEARVLNMAAGQHRAAFRWPDPLTDPGRDHERHQERSGEFCPPRREHGFEAPLPQQRADGDPDDEDRHPAHEERGKAQALPPRTPNGCLPSCGGLVPAWGKQRHAFPGPCCPRLRLRSGHRNSSAPAAPAQPPARLC